MAKKVATMGKIARFSIVDRRLFHSLDAERISEEASRLMRQTTAMMLTSETPIVEKALTTEDVALNVLAATNEDVVLIVPNIDDNILPSRSLVLFLSTY